MNGHQLAFFHKCKTSKHFSLLSLPDIPDVAIIIVRSCAFLQGSTEKEIVRTKKKKKKKSKILHGQIIRIPHLLDDAANP